MRPKPHKPSPKQTGEPRLSRGRTRPGAIFPVAPPASSLPESYATTLQEIKTHLRNARVRAVLAANPIVIEAYWQTGKIILARQQEAAWGAKVIDRLAADLQEAFPDMGGLTRRNLFFMRAFAESFPDGPIVKQLVSQLPWGQIIRLIQMVKDPAVRDFYIRETLHTLTLTSEVIQTDDEADHDWLRFACTQLGAGPLPPEPEEDGTGTEARTAWIDEAVAGFSRRWKTLETFVAMKTREANA